jgi:hypothetical protein
VSFVDACASKRRSSTCIQSMLESKLCRTFSTPSCHDERLWSNVKRRLHLCAHPLPRETTPKIPPKTCRSRLLKTVAGRTADAGSLKNSTIQFSAKPLHSSSHTYLSFHRESIYPPMGYRVFLATPIFVRDTFSANLRLVIVSARHFRSGATMTNISVLLFPPNEY